MGDEEVRQQLAKLKYQGRDWGEDFYKPNVYSEAFLNEVLNDLRIFSELGRAEMEKSIIHAAMYYEHTKRSHLQNYRPQGFYQRKLNATLKPAQQLHKKLTELDDGGSIGVWPILDAVKELVAEGNYPRQAGRYINAMLERDGDEDRYDWRGFLSFLGFYCDVTERAMEKPVGKNAAHKSFPIETWLRNLSHAWQTHSPMPFTAGKYHQGIGYNSEAIQIMKKIMEPLDDSVTLQFIANKLTEFIRKESKKKIFDIRKIFPSTTCNEKHPTRLHKASLAISKRSPNGVIENDFKAAH